MYIYIYIYIYIYGLLFTQNFRSLLLMLTLQMALCAFMYVCMHVFMYVCKHTKIYA